MNTTPPQPPHRSSRGLAGLVTIIVAIGLVATAGAQTNISEDFSSGSLPSTLAVSGGGSTTYSSGAVVFNGNQSNGSDRTYFHTIGSDYASVSWTADIVVTVVSSLNAGSSIAYFGLGSGTPNAASFYQPDTTPSIFLQVYPNNWPNSQIGTVDNGSLSENGANGTGGNGTHRLQLSWNATTSFLTASIDRNYAGGAFVADTTLTSVDGSSNGFNATNARVFFGGAGGLTFDDFSVTVAAVPEPSTYAGIFGLGALGFVAWRRRPRPA